MGHCKHHWHEVTSTLQTVFHGSERRHHAFYVCKRCLAIDEVLAPPMPMPLPQPQPDSAASPVAGAPAPAAWSSELSAA